MGEGWGATELVAMLEAAGASIWGLDLSGRCAFINDAACQMLGYSRERCMGQDMHETIHGRCANGPVCSREECPVLHALHTGIGIRLDRHVMWRSDGTPLSIDLYAQPVVVNGNPKGLVVCAFDITRRKRAEEALRASEALFRTAFDNALIGISIVDLEGRYSQANQTFCRITGYTEQELLQTGFDALTHPDDREEGRELGRALKAGEMPGGVLTKRYVRKDGQLIWVCVSVSLVRDTQGNPLHFVTLVEDISERKRAEEKRRQFELLTEQSRDAILCLRDDKRILEANAAAAEAYGYTRDELLKLTIQDLVAPGAPLLNAAQLAEAFEHGILFETVHRRKDGSTFPVEASARGTTIGGARVMFSSVRDITERKRAEESLRKSEEWLRFTQDEAGVGIWDWDAATGETKASDQQFRLYGLDPATKFPAQDEFLRLIHPGDRDRLTRELNSATAGESIFASQFRVVWPDTTVHWLFAHGRAFLSQTGEPARFIGVNVDVTDRIQAESALQQFFTVSDSPLLVIGFDGHMTRANSALLKVMGYTIEEVRSRQFTEFFHPDDAPAIRAEFARICVHGGTSRGEVRVMCKDGSHPWFLFSATASEDERLVYVATHDITEQKRVEAALVEEVARRRVLFDQSKDGIVVFDPSGKTIESNESFARMLGYSMEEMRQLYVWDYDGCMTRDQILEGMKKARSTPGTFESRHRRKDGTLADVEISSTGIELATGLVYYAVTRDITDRKRAEAALAEETARRRVIFEQSKDGIVIFDASGKTTEANQSFADMLGYSVEEMRQLYIWDFHSDLSRDQILKKLETFRAAPQTFEVRHRRKDGTELDVEVSATAMELGAGFVYSAVVRDITDRKRAGEALRISERRFKLIAETVDEAFWMTDAPISEMIYISPGYERIWGRTLESLYKDPRSFLDPVHPEDLEPARAHLERMKSGLPLDHEYRILRPGGSLAWVWNRGFPVRGATGEVEFYVGVALDITERKRMEEAIKVHAGKLARSNAELERFAYVASHDLQEPLRMVASFTQLLAKRYAGKLDEKADRYIHYAVDGATRMQQMISDLLAYSRVGSKALDLRLTECETVVAASLENLRAAINESGASVTWDPLPTFMADPMQLCQLFQNLLGNAIKFKRELPPHVHISAVDGGSEWLFSVRDNGIGIDPKNAESIFQVFYRLHGREEYPGTGIGLALVKAVVERHGGKIWVDSEVGVGSNFRFTIRKMQMNRVVDDRGE
jgi:PAS domain S-box-containing protein